MHLSQHAISSAQMFPLPVAPKRDYMGMLAYQQNIGKDARFARLHEFALQIARGTVCDGPPIDDPDSALVFTCFIHDVVLRTAQ
jgi:hypothetical protein